MIFVLDAGAMIAFLRREPVSAVVADACKEVNSLIAAHVMNLCEVYYDCARSGGESASAQAMAVLTELGVRHYNDLDQPFWQTAALLKATHRKISLADRFCLTLAQRLGARLLTADRHEMARLVPLGICDIHFIR